MTILKSMPYILTNNNGSIIIGIERDSEDQVKIGDTCAILLKERHLLGIVNEVVIFNFDLSENKELEDLVSFAFYSESNNKNQMINVWEANDDGMIPWNNIIYLK